MRHWPCRADTGRLEKITPSCSPVRMSRGDMWECVLFKDKPGHSDTFVLCVVLSCTSFGIHYHPRRLKRSLKFEAGLKIFSPKPKRQTTATGIKNV